MHGGLGYSGKNIIIQEYCICANIVINYFLDIDQDVDAIAAFLNPIVVFIVLAIYFSLRNFMNHQSHFVLFYLFFFSFCDLYIYVFLISVNVHIVNVILYSILFSQAFLTRAPGSGDLATTPYAPDFK